MRVTPEQQKVIKRDIARPPTSFDWYLEVITFGMLVVGTVRVALAQATSLSPWLLGIGMVGILGAVVWLLVETSRSSRA